MQVGAQKINPDVSPDSSASAKKHSGTKSIDEALSILDEAARESGQEIREMITSDYSHLKKTFSEFAPQVRSALRDMQEQTVAAIREARDRTAERTLEASRAVNESAHRSPWTYVAGAVATGGVIGYLLGRQRRRS